MSLVGWKPTPTESNLLTAQGLPGYLFRQRDFDLKDYVRRWVHDPGNMHPKQYSQADQLLDWETLREDTAGHSYVACISSEPNDLRAKVAAAGLALNALRIHRENRRAYTHSAPKWHTVTGGFSDRLKDARGTEFANFRGLLVLSNVVAESTYQKWELLRDILELYSNCPRVVVTSGSDPVSFFNDLHYPLNYHLWIRSKRMIRAI